MIERTIIIAEAGVNHNGSIVLAKQLVDIAAEAGADFVKFQTFKAENLVSKSAPKAQYQSQNVQNFEETQFKMLKKLELSEDHHHILFEYCKLKKIGFLSAGFDELSVDFLDLLGVSMFKIPSGEITNKPYLQHIARKKKDVIISTGMSNMLEVKNAIQVLLNEGLSLENIIILHCNTQYPTPMKDVNLKAMLTLQNEFGTSVGYSDHTLGIEVPIAAVALGAKFIEKHFTINRDFEGPDHKASLEPNELKSMIGAIRNIEEAMSGNGEKTPSNSEIENINVARKSIHYSQNFPSNHMLDYSDFIMIRPGNGISPMDIDNCVGKKLVFDVVQGEMVKWEDFI